MSRVLYAGSTRKGKKGSKKKGSNYMKKLTKICSLAIAAVMTTSAAASAMTFNEPMSHEFPFDSFYKGEQFYSGYGHSYYHGISSYKGTNYYDNGYTPEATEGNENPEKIIDSYDGESKYLHLESNASNPNSNCVFNVMKDWAANWDNTRFVGSFGKTRLEAIIRLDDYIGTNNGGNNDIAGGGQNFSLVLEAVNAAETGSYGLGIKGYYPQTADTTDTNKVTGIMLESCGTTASGTGYLTALEFGKWYRIRIDADVQNSAVEFTFDRYDASGNIDWTRTYERTMQATKCIAGSWLRYPATLMTLDIAEMKQTRDGMDIKTVDISDSTDNTVTASVQVASNAPANDSSNTYKYIDSNGSEQWTTQAESTKWSYDGDSGEERCVSRTTSPTLILAQYDEGGRLLGVQSKALDTLPTLLWGRTLESGKKKASADTGFEHKNIEITFDKETGYSYAKAYVWNNMSELVPYTESVSTQKVEEETSAE